MRAVREVMGIDIENKNLWRLFEWGGEQIYVTQTLLATWVVMALLIGLAVVVRVRLRTFKEVPSGFQNVVETAVETMSNMARSTMGDRLEFLGGYFFSVFAFILMSNYSGLLGFKPPTTDLATTIPLALTTFLLIHILGAAQQGKEYFREFFRPNPLFLPLNLIDDLAKPLSLAFRLFGNILGGVIVLELMYHMLPLVCRFILPDVAHAYFDFFAGALQAFIFTMLSMTFIRQKAASE